MKTLVVYHSADFDGLFCREIARKFIADAELVGWNFGDAPLKLPEAGEIVVMDLPMDEPFGLKFKDGWVCEGEKQTMPLDRVLWDRWTWIDHHGSSIASHPAGIPGYRIDGVAACRLAWQWFRNGHNAVRLNDESKRRLHTREEFIDRKVAEPQAVRLAGEYDIWDKRDPDAELFQCGLRSQEITEFKWNWMFTGDQGPDQAVPHRYNTVVLSLLDDGKIVQFVKNKENQSIIAAAGFTVEFEGLRFLACNHARYNSHLFTAGLRPEHEGCLGFAWRGGEWHVSLYHAPGKEHHDLAAIAVKHGGGGHRGACGFRMKRLPWLEA